MRSLLLLLLVSASSFAQIHQNQPIPEIQEESVKVISDDIIGWSKSLDGQWVSMEMTIPPRAVSRDQEAYEGNESELGMDNISELHLYKTNYGEETLYTLVKISRHGSYKYKATQQKWQESQVAYYFVFDADQMKLINEVSEKSNQVKIPLRDYGSLSEVSTRQLVESLNEVMVVRPETDRALVMSLKLDSEHADKVYFQLSSQHKIFPEVEGVLHDFQIQGTTVYSTPFLLDYLHYEYDNEAFKNFFSAE